MSTLYNRLIFLNLIMWNKVYRNHWRLTLTIYNYSCEKSVLLIFLVCVGNIMWILTISKVINVIIFIV